MEAVVVPVLAKISEYLVAPIGNQLSYLFQLSGNVKTLENELEKLKIMKVPVQQDVDLARNNVHTILDHVETWLVDVGTTESDVQQIVEDKAQFPKGCLNGWCLNLKPRYVLSRRAKKKTKDIINLQQKGNFQRVASPSPPEQFIGSTSTEVLNSREVIVKKIIKILKDENVNMIGLCGTGGIGKTTMVKKVFNRVEKQNMFDDCVMTVVSQKAEMINVQRDIAGLLNLTFEKDNMSVRASLLKKRLEGKKVLIILDDVWEELDLGAIGITLQDGQRGCKIVYTSRTEDLWKELGSRRTELPLQSLTDDESWTLFKDKIGDSLNDKPEVVAIAKKIVKKCAGLPLALVTVGSALHGKEKPTWKDTLQRLQTYSEMDEIVIESLKLSYDHLGKEEAKSVFLLCSLFKEDSLIDVESLVNLGMGLRLFKSINSIEAARNRVFAMVEHLKSRCLVSIVTDSDRTGCFVKVHDVVRDVSKTIARAERGSLVIEHGFTLETSLEESSSDHCTWISDLSEGSKELLSTLQFPKLELLRCSNDDIQISESCFDGMVKLQVVDITCCSDEPPVLKLPSLLQSLTRLHTLCLRNLRLENFTAIKFLLSLEILRIGDRCIEELPKEIGQLTKLRLLDMSDCYKLKKIWPGIISRLSRLEELYLGGLISDWGAEETQEGRNADHGEFESLSNLRILHFAIKDPRMLPRTLLLEKYQIQIGDEEFSFISASRNYEKKVSISDVALVNNSTFYLRNSEALLLKGESTKILVSELVREASQSIKYLEIHDTDTPEYLANATDRTKAPFLVSTLESLTLSNVNNLLHIINGPLVAGQFIKLKKLSVRNCNQLRNIFRLSNGIDVLHLEKLYVNDCESMEEVICWERREEDATSKLQFPKLIDLHIGGDWRSRSPLVCFCRGANEIEFHQLETLELRRIPAVECITSSIPNDSSLNSLFPHKVFFPSLVQMELTILENMKEIWCGQLQSTGSFLNLSELKIIGCDSLEYVFSPYMATYLVHLQRLDIENCQSLNEIVNGPLMMGSSLLKLKELRVWKCNQLRNLLRLSTAVDTLDLEELSIKDCERMAEVISWEGRPEEDAATRKLHFPNLRKLKIEKASSLKCFCKGAMEIEFYQLTSLVLSNLPAECLVPIFFPHKVFFPSLVKMELNKLKNMKEIWCGQLQSTGSFLNLSELNIWRCDSLEYVFSPYMATYLVHLQRLHIYNCRSLKEIVNGPLMMGSSLLKLKNLTVEGCNQLRNLLRLSTAVDTLDLEELSIYNCERMEEVISWEGRPEEDVATRKLLFPKLLSLTIYNASSLICFCKGDMEIEFHQLTRLVLWDLPAVECLVPISNKNPLKSIFPHKVFFPSLVEMELNKLKNMKEIWCGQLQPTGSFLNLSTLKIKECESLEYVFSPYMATYLIHLQRLDIENCQSLKEIVNGPLMMGNSLLKLKVLRVVSCNKLRNLLQLSTAVDTLDLEKLWISNCESMEEVISWEGRPEEDAATRKLLFPNLRRLDIEKASSLKCFCKGAMEIEFHQLTSLDLFDLPAIEFLVPIFFPHKVLFPSLSTLKIHKCHGLEYVFSPYTASYLVHLRRLDIAECKNLKEVISAEKEVDGIEEYSKRILPKLKDVKLYQLLALERFYHVANDIEFPELDNAVVVDCPVFKFFSPVSVHTPILSHVKLYEEFPWSRLKEEEK